MSGGQCARRCLASHERGDKGIWKISFDIFAELHDPRMERNREHLLEEILLIAIAVVLSGAESWNEMEEYSG
ncbi:MAG: transposase family protein [Acidobacteriaceae bacterium]